MAEFWTKQIESLKAEGWSALFRKSLRVLLLVGEALAVIFLLPFAVILRLTNKIYPIRYGYFMTHRIGHFSFDLEYHLSGAELDSTNQSTMDLFYFVGKPANKFLANLAKRSLRIHPIVRILHRSDKLLGYGVNNYLEPAWLLTGSRDYDGRFEKTYPHLRFTVDEERQGVAFLNKFGISGSEKFVCLIVRDSAYLESLDGPGTRDYHSYRDTDIKDYRHTAITLARKGYWVFRMGKIVQNEFGVDNPRIIDYANSGYRSDFLDIWLMSRCFFCISTSTGFDSIADMFRKPFAFVNFMPLRLFQTWSKCVLAPSHLIWENDRTRLTCREHLEHGYQSIDQYKAQNIIIDPLKPDEITETVMELERRLTGEWSASPQELDKQRKFWELYRQYGGETPPNGYYHPKAYLSASFLRQNEKFLR